MYYWPRLSSPFKANNTLKESKMASISLNSLFLLLEEQVGKAVLISAMTAYISGAPAAESAVPVKPKRVGKPMTEEHKAKMAAGREAAKAKKAAAAAAAAAAPAPAAAAEPPATDGNESTASSQKKRGPKAKKDMTPAELAAHEAKVAERKAKKASERASAAATIPLPTSSDENEHDPEVFAESIIKGDKYLRNYRGDLLTLNYEWVGRYDGKKIDTTFKKPADLKNDDE